MRYLIVLIAAGCTGRGFTGTSTIPAGSHGGAFHIDRYKVTADAYERCVAAGACPASPRRTNDRHEAATVGAFAADAYCRWRGGRLPSPAEWEAAGRGPQHYAYPWGNTYDRARLSWPRLYKTSRDLGFEYNAVSERDARSPFGVYGQVGRPEFTRAPDGDLEMRGGPARPVEDPSAYLLAVGRPAVPDQIATFRCAYA